PDSIRCFGQTIFVVLTAACVLAPNSASAQPGSLDLSFHPGAGGDQSVYSMLVQGDGKIVIGGDFTTVDNLPRKGNARLGSDGQVDSGFNPGTGADDLVSAMAMQGNKIIIAGYFTSVDDVPRGSIARLNSDGSLDETFDPGDGADGPILALAVQSDGKILV